jgi:hypothetical protein
MPVAILASKSALIMLLYITLSNRTTTVKYNFLKLLLIYKADGSDH